MADIRYCQECGETAAPVAEENQYQAPKPCRVCGGTYFRTEPKPHRWQVWALTPEDRTFLRVQGIDPDKQIP